MEKRKVRILILPLVLIALLIAGFFVVKHVNERKIYIQNRNTLRSLQIFSRDDNCTEQYVNRYQASGIKVCYENCGIKKQYGEDF